MRFLSLESLFERLGCVRSGSRACAAWRTMAKRADPLLNCANRVGRQVEQRKLRPREGNWGRAQTPNWNAVLLSNKEQQRVADLVPPTDDLACAGPIVLLCCVASLAARQFPVFIDKSLMGAR